MSIINIVQKNVPLKSHNQYVKAVIDIVKKCEETEGGGLILELGVAKGRNTIIFGNLIKHLDLDLKYVGFDTFDGYTKEDLNSVGSSMRTKLLRNNKNWKIKKETVMETIRKADLEDVCTLVEGDLKKTLPEFLENHKKGSVSLLYVDCNTYLSSLHGMKAAWDYIKKGGIICIDEHLVGGETQAIKEFEKICGCPIVWTKDKIGIPAYIVKN